MSREDFKLLKDVEIDSLLLDPRNARIRTGHDQEDCIARILRKESQLIALAEDIAANGLTTMPILVSPGPTAKHYIVRDGNRRVTALKLLNDPARWSPDARLRERFEAIVAAAPDPIPSHVDVLFSVNESAVLAEVLARHSGANEGVGQLDWDAYLRTVFLVSHQLPVEYKRPGQYAFWAEDHGIDVSDNFPITSLQRFFSKDHLALLGFDIDANDQLKPNLRLDVVKKIAATVLGDFASSRVKVGDVFTPADAANYINAVRRMHGLADPEAPPASTPAPPPTPAPPSGPGAAPPPSPTPSAPAPSTAPRPPPTPRQAPADRKRLFGSGAPGIAVPDAERKAATVVTELRKMDMNDTPLAAAVMLRVLIELSDGYYRKKNSIADQQKLFKNIKSSAKHMLDRTMLSESEHDITLRTVNDEKAMLQLETLQKMVHKDTHHLTKQFVNTMWDNIGHFVRACWR